MAEEFDLRELDPSVKQEELDELEERRDQLSQLREAARASQSNVNGQSAQ